jgi:anti-sigma regulatory factor (Ser/Thr protein kinase)
MNAGVEFVQGLEIRGRADSVGLGITARQLAEACGWSARDRAELSILVVELATNALRHAGCGTCRLEIEPREARVIVDDGGPGFPDWVLERHAQSLAVEGGRPHREGGLGAGLDSCARLADTLTLENRAPSGAHVVAVRKRRHA